MGLGWWGASDVVEMGSLTQLWGYHTFAGTGWLSSVIGGLHPGGPAPNSLLNPPKILHHPAVPSVPASMMSPRPCGFAQDSPFASLPQLIIVACDQGQPPYETMQPLQVALDDIDDNEPIFLRPPVRHQGEGGGMQGVQGMQGMQGWGCQRANVTECAHLGAAMVGCTVGFVCFYLKRHQCSQHSFSWGLWQKDSPQYQALSVPEHSQPGTVVGNVTGAVDADEGSNAIVYYFIAGGDGSSVSPTHPQITQDFCPLPAAPLFWKCQAQRGLTGGCPFCTQLGTRRATSS